MIKRLNKIIDILNKRTKAAGIDLNNIDQIQIIVTYIPGDTKATVHLESKHTNYTVSPYPVNIIPRFWDDISDNFDLQKYVRECLEQLNH